MSDMMLDFENDLLAFFRDPKLPKGARELALFCSVPYFLTPELVLRIRDGMNITEDTDDPQAEVLQAPFVRHMMGDYYRMERVVRDVLRHWLRTDYDAATEERVARLLRQYVDEKRSKPGDLFWQEYLDAQMVAAQAIIEPRQIAEQIAYGLQKYDHHTEAEERDRVTRWSLLAQEAETDLRRIGVGRLVDYARYRSDQLRKREVAFIPEDLREGMTVFGSIKLPALSPSQAAATRGGSKSENGLPEVVGRTHIASGHHGMIYHLAWSADGRYLLSSGQDDTLRVWRLDIQRDSSNANEIEFALREVRQIAATSVRTLAWSPDGTAAALTGFPVSEAAFRIRKLDGSPAPEWQYKVDEGKILSLAWASQQPLIAVGADNYQVAVIDARSGNELRRFFADAEVSCLAFSPDGRMLAAGTQKNTSHVIYVWDLRTEKLLQVMRGHEGGITCLRWWPGENILVSGSVDASVWVWDVSSGKKLRALRNHSAPITSITISHDGTMLASAAQDSNVCFWSSEKDWRLVYLTQYASMTHVPCDIAFHPTRPLLAAVTDQRNISLTAFNLDAIHKQEDIQTVYYSTAKVVVVGDGGAGKTSLCSALVDEKSPMETDGTYTLNVFKLSRTYRHKDMPIRREIYFWDLAGQGDYQLINQLYLNNVSAALLVFARNNVADPFRGLRRWDKVLQNVQDKGTSSAARTFGQRVLKFLVQTRMDLQDSSVPQRSIDQLMEQTNCAAFFQTSAKDSRGIRELREAIEKQIDWNASGQDITTVIYDKIRRFLEWVQKNEDIQIASSQQLFVRYLEYALPDPDEDIPTLRYQFETCLNYLEARQLVRRFDFRKLVLLRPELLNVYAASIIRAAGRGDNQMFGSIEERTILNRTVEIPADKRVRKPKEEEWMLMATIHDLLRFEVALLEEGMLIFPSHFVAGWDSEFEHEGQEQLVFTFEGAVINIYAMLVVRLSRSEHFKRVKLARRKVQFEATDGGRCGLTLSDDDHTGKISVYFSLDVSTLTRYTFDIFVYDTLKRESLKSSLKRKQVYYCANPACPNDIRIRFDDTHVEARKALGRNDIICPICGELTPITEPPITKEMADILKLRQAQMRRRADQVRDLEAAESMYRNKQATGNYDVFIEGWGASAADIKQLTNLLRLRGIYMLEGQMEVSDIADKVLSVVFLVGQKRMSRSELQLLEQRVQQYMACALPVIFALYQITDIPEVLLKMTRLESRMVYFFDELDDQRNLSELVSYITGKDPR
jgi:small GTP-binding protein